MHFITYIGNCLRADYAKFLNYFRMPQSSCDEPYDKLKPKISRQDTNMRSAIPRLYHYTNILRRPISC